MSPGLAALAIGLAAAGVLSIVTRDTRSSIVALAVVAVAAPVLAAGPPEPLPLAARLLAGLLAAYLLWAAVRGHPGMAGSALGILGTSVLAVAAGVAGYAGAAAGPVPPGTTGTAGVAVPEAIAAGVALLVTGGPPLLASRDALRTAVGGLLAVHGAWLVRSGLAGTPVASEELALAVLVVALGAGGAVLIARARDASGTLELGARRPVAARTRAPGTDQQPAPRDPGATARSRPARHRSPTP